MCILYVHHKIQVLAYTEKVCKQKAKDEIMASNFCSYDKSGPKCVFHMTKAQLNMCRCRNHNFKQLTIEAEYESPLS